MTKVSIIIPVYNVEKYIERCLKSLSEQTLEDIEIICIDDKSTDNSLSVLKDFASRDERIKIIELDKNVGVGAARNEGLKIAQGTYLGFVDPDDAVELEFYEKLYNKGIETNADIVKGNIKTFHLDGRIVESVLNKSIRKNKFAFINRWISAIYKHNLIKVNNISFPNIRKIEDNVFLNRVVLNAKTIEIIDDTYYLNYKREGSLNANKISIEGINAAIEGIKILLNDLNNSDLYNQNIDDYIYAFNQRMKIITSHFWQTDCEEERQLLVNAIIDCFHMCKSIKCLKKDFIYFPLLKFFIKKDKKTLIKKLSNYGNYAEFNKAMYEYQKYTIGEKLFSVKNKNNHKIITILGIKIKIKRKKKDE